VIAFFWNLSFGEIAVVLILAVLIFGKRLPQVAGEAYRTVAKLRRHFEDLRRESGIDREIFDVKRTFRDAAREAEAEPVVKKAPVPDTPKWSEDRREEVADEPDAEPAEPSGSKDAGESTELAEPRERKPDADADVSR